MDFFGFAIGILSLVSGIPMAVWPHRKRKAAQAAWSERLAQLDAGAEETFFEERRSLLAYPPYKSDRKMRAAGIFLVLCGIAMIALSITETG